MGFKKMETNFSFADISLFSSLERNRAIKRMQQINAIVDWSRIENLLLRNWRQNELVIAHSTDSGPMHRPESKCDTRKNCVKTPSL